MDDGGERSEFWTQLRNKDGQRQIKRADGSEDLPLRCFWEGLPAPTIALRMLRESGRASEFGYASSKLGRVAAAAIDVVVKPGVDGSLCAHVAIWALRPRRPGSARRRPESAARARQLLTAGGHRPTAAVGIDMGSAEGGEVLHGKTGASPKQQLPKRLTPL